VAPIKPLDLENKDAINILHAAIDYSAIG